ANSVRIVGSRSRMKAKNCSSSSVIRLVSSPLWALHHHVSLRFLRLRLTRPQTIYISTRSYLSLGIELPAGQGKMRLLFEPKLPLENGEAMYSLSVTGNDIG